MNTPLPTNPEAHLRHALTHHAFLDCGVIFDAMAFPVYAHDDREAPYLVGADKAERCEQLVSITDEGGDRLLAWVRVPKESDVAGIGIDLCSANDFLADEAGERFAQLLFTPGEKRLVDQMPGSLPMRRAKVFSAKEAAFKSTAAALRRWYESHDEEVFFEAMDFELKEGCLAGGHDRPRRGNRVDKACETLGISRIEISFSEYRGMAFCVAVAVRQAAPRHPTPLDCGVLAL